MTFKCTHQGALYIDKTLVVELLSQVFLINLEKTEEIQKHYDQFITNLYLVFPF